MSAQYLIPQLEHRANLATGVQHHVPCQFGDLAGTKASLDRQQYDETVAKGEAGMIGEKEKIVDMVSRKYLGLLTRHIVIKSAVNGDSKPIRSNCNGNHAASDYIAFRQKLISLRKEYLCHEARGVRAEVNVSRSVGSAT